MKKITAFVLILVLLSASVCGCGRKNTNEVQTVPTAVPGNTPAVSANPNDRPELFKPLESPDMMPDAENGEVKDTDGFIDEKETDLYSGSPKTSRIPESKY